jgi:hypothetical protein
VYCLYSNDCATDSINTSFTADSGGPGIYHFLASKVAPEFHYPGKFTLTMQKSATDGYGFQGQVDVQGVNFRCNKDASGKILTERPLGKLSSWPMDNTITVEYLMFKWETIPLPLEYFRDPTGCYVGNLVVEPQQAMSTTGI